MRHSINPTRSSLDRPADGPRSPSLIDLTPAFSFHEIFTRYEISPFSSISFASRSSELAAGFQAGRKAGKHIRRACDFPLFFLRLRALLLLIFYNIKPTSEIVEHVILLALPLPLLSFHLSLSFSLSFSTSLIFSFPTLCISLLVASPSVSLSPSLPFSTFTLLAPVLSAISYATYLRASLPFAFFSDFLLSRISYIPSLTRNKTNNHPR